MPKHQSEAIMEKLMSRMVQRPTQLAQKKEKELNKKIESVFELNSFQKMVDNADENLNTKSFIG
jgi:hypothetical protein